MTKLSEPSVASSIAEDKACILQVVGRLENEIDGLRARIETLSSENIQLKAMNARIVNIETYLGLFI